MCMFAAWVHGDPRKVIYPTDSYSCGQFCSQKDPCNENKTIFYHFNILKCASPIVSINLQCPRTQLCVSECPNRFVTYIDVQASYRYKPDQWNYLKQFCKPGFKSPHKSAAQVLRDGDCPSMIIPSRPRMSSDSGRRWSSPGIRGTDTCCYVLVWVLISFMKKKLQFLQAAQILTESKFCIYYEFLNCYRYYCCYSGAPRISS
ncbi:choline transporter-like protein 5 isoform 1-T1 [Guaruba guarouba]